MTQTKAIRVGIIGLGKMGCLRAEELSLRDDVALVRVYDPNPEAFRQQWPHIPCARDSDGVIASDVDVVFVCVPNALVADTVVAALEAGKHVFAEKPPGCTVADVERIRAAEARHPERKLAFGFNHRFHAGIQEAYRIARGGRLGELLWIRGIYGKSDVGAAWRSDKSLAGGGILLDQGVHMLDLVRMFMGDPVEVKSMVTAAHWDVGVEDNAFALLRNAQGHIAQVHSSSTQWKHRFSFEVYLSKGYLSVDGILTSSRSYGDETLTIARKGTEDAAGGQPPAEETVYFDEDPSWAAELEAFFAAIHNDTPVLSGNSEQALRAMELVYAIYQDDTSFMASPAAPEQPAP